MIASKLLVVGKDIDVDEVEILMAALEVLMAALEFGVATTVTSLSPELIKPDPSDAETATVDGISIISVITSSVVEFCAKV